MSIFCILDDTLNISPIDGLGKGILDMVELRCEPSAEQAGIHSNSESSNHLVLDQPQILTISNESEGGEGAKALKKSKPSKTLYENPLSMIALRDCWPVLA